MAALLSVVGAILPARSAKAAAQTPPTASTERTSVTLQVRDVDLTAALDGLFAQSPGNRYALAPGVSGRRIRVSVSLRQMPFEAALRTLLRSAATSETLRFVRRPDGVYEIAPAQSKVAAPAPAAKPQAPQTLTLDLRNAPLEDALRLVFGAEPGRYTVQPAGLARTATVTAVFRGLPLPEALDQIAAGATPRLRWTRAEAEGAVLFTAEDPSRSEPAESTTGDAARPPVSMDVRDAEVRAVITDLFRQAGVKDYSFAADVRSFVTLRLQNKPLDEALDLLARVASPPLRIVRLPNGLYEIRRRTAGGGTGGR